MTVSSEVKKEDSKTEDNYTRREFSFSSFKRSFTLPDSVNVDNVKATYENGVLKLVLPKKEEALPKPKRLIELS
jgi:HSP20 family protein